MWSNLAQKFFDLVKFLCPGKAEFPMVRDRAWGIWGELK